MYKLVISLRYIKSRLITLFSILGIAIGVTVLLAVLSVMDGFRKEVKAHLQGTLSDIVISVHVPDQEYKELEKKILSVPNVKACAPHLKGLVLFGADYKYAGGIVVGIDYQREREVGKLDDYLMTAYREHKLWSENLLKNNSRGSHRFRFQWKVLESKKVYLPRYKTEITRVLCAEIRHAKPNWENKEAYYRLRFQSFFVENNIIVLMEKDLEEKQISHAFFAEGDFRYATGKDQYGLALKLAHPETDLSKYLAQKISIKPSEMANIKSHKLAKEMNRLLVSEDIYDNKRFQSITLNAETKNLLEKLPQGLELIRLNRLLLEQAYPEDIVHYRLLRKNNIDFEELLLDLQNQDENPISEYLVKHFTPKGTQVWQQYQKAYQDYQDDPSDEKLQEKWKSMKDKTAKFLYLELLNILHGQIFLGSLDIIAQKSLDEEKIPDKLKDLYEETPLPEEIQIKRIDNKNWIVRSKNREICRITATGEKLEVYDLPDRAFFTDYEDLDLSAKTEKMLERKEKLNKKELALLNTCLLEDAYPYAITPIRPLDYPIQKTETLKKWQEYFNIQARLLKERKLTKYLDLFSKDLYTISLKKAHLFVLAPYHRENFDETILEDELLEIFEEYKIRLSGQVKLQVEKKGSRWRLIDGFRQYLLIMEKENIKVYAPRLLLTCPQKCRKFLDEEKWDITLQEVFKKHRVPVKNMVIEKKGNQTWRLFDQDLKRSYVAVKTKEKNHIEIYMMPDSQINEQSSFYWLEEKSLNPDLPFIFYHNDSLRPIILGYDLMKALRVRRGQTIALMTGKKNESVQELKDSLKAVSRKFVVAGSFRSGWQELDAQLAYTPIKNLSDFVDISSEVTEICVALEDFQKADQSKALLSEILNSPISKNARYKDFEVARWEEKRKSLLSAIELQRGVMTFILALIVLLAVATIMIILVLLVKEKTKDIGILKAMGASDWGIMSIFVLNGLCISFLGSTIGIGAGVWLSLKINWIADCIYRWTGIQVFPRDVYYLDKIPVEITWYNIGAIVGSTLSLSLIACLIPAFQAARMDAVEALNSESPSLNLWKKRIKKSDSKNDKTPEGFYGAKQLGKTYPTVRKPLRVFDQINLDLEQGEIVVILGSSGAGKSTLLHIMGLLDRPSEGMVFLKGINLNNFSPREQAKVRNRNIGFIFQFYHLLPEFTALENVLLGAMIRYRTMRWIKKRKACVEKARTLLTRVGLAERMHHLPQQLSGGERQRVAVARALINDPQIVLCDEPTGNLDIANSKGVQEILWQLNQDLNQTFIIVTHEKSIAAKGNRVFKIERGNLRQITDLEAE